MVYILMKSEARLQHETFCGKQFGADPGDPLHREYRECVAAKTREAIKELEKKGKYAKF